MGRKQQFISFSGEYEIFSKLWGSPRDVIHPFSLIPLLGQVLLLITLFQKSPWRSLTFAGITCIGLLLIFIFVIGIIGPNFRMLVSTLPFLGLSTYVMTTMWARKSGKESRL